jgi:16S rRNA (guanine527-N7)-methyltransferase
MTTFSFPIDLTEDQTRLLEEYGRMLFDVNKQFNLISRSDIKQVFNHHIAHCLTIAERGVPGGSRVVDWGSGGGLPAIPLAIVWPEVHITAVDSNSKKTMSIDLFCRRLGITNCVSLHGRAEQAEGQFNYSVSRATAPLLDLWSWHERVYVPGSELAGWDQSSALPEDTWAEGLICLKGGDLDGEVQDMNRRYHGLETDIRPLTSLKHDPYFEQKYIVHVRREDGVS